MLGFVVKVISLPFNAWSELSGGQTAVLISSLIACRNLKVYGRSNILVHTDFAFGLVLEFPAVFLPFTSLCST